MIERCESTWAKLLNHPENTTERTNKCRLGFKWATWTYWANVEKMRTLFLLPTPPHRPHLVWGSTLPTNRKMAFSGGSWMRFRMMYKNWATEMSEGSRYFLLSMSTIWDLGTFSRITYRPETPEITNPHSSSHGCASRSLNLPEPGRGTCCVFWLIRRIGVLGDKCKHRCYWYWCFAKQAEIRNSTLINWLKNNNFTCLWSKNNPCIHIMKVIIECARWNWVADKLGPFKGEQRGFWVM